MKQFGIILGIIIIIAGGIWLWSSKTTVPSDVQGLKDVNTADEYDAARENIELKEGEYMISQGEVSYTAQKRFLSRPTDVVVGVSPAVSGVLLLDEENNQWSVAVEIVPTFTTNSSGRDQDVSKFFTGSMFVTAENSALDPSFFDGTQVNMQAPLNLIINDTEHEIEFSITAVRDISNNAIVAYGNATFAMSDFGISPPSLINVYTVDDEIEVKFEFVATR